MVMQKPASNLLAEFIHWTPKGRHTRGSTGCPHILVSCQYVHFAQPPFCHQDVDLLLRRPLVSQNENFVMLTPYHTCVTKTTHPSISNACHFPLSFPPLHFGWPFGKTVTESRAQRHNFEHMHRGIEHIKCTYRSEFVQRQARDCVVTTCLTSITIAGRLTVLIPYVG